MSATYRTRYEPTLDDVEDVLTFPDAGGGWFSVTDVWDWLYRGTDWHKRTTIANRLDALTRAGRAVCEWRPVGVGGQEILTYRAPGPPLGDPAVACQR